MKIIVKKQLQKAMLEVEIEEKSEKEAIAKALFFAQPDYCGLCKGQNIIWDYNKATTEDGTFTYIRRRCLACKGVSTAGEYKTGGLFWKAWEIYQPKQQPQNQQNPKAEISEEDLAAIPF